MSFRNMVIAVTFLLVFFAALQFSVDSDTWWQLRSGEFIAEQRAIPTTDSFSYTRAGEPWRYPSNAWLGELKLFLINHLFGLGGLNVWVAAMVTLAFSFIYLAMSGRLLLKSFVLVLAVLASGIYWAARPYMVSLVLAAAFLWILEDFRWGSPEAGRRFRRLLWLPALMMVWVNSHPGFAIGFLLLAVYLLDEGVRWAWARYRGNAKTQKVAGDRLSSLALIALTVLVAACINPAGPAVLAYPFETLSIGALGDSIQEWQSPDFHSLQAQPFAWLLLILMGVLGAAHRPLALSDFLLVAGFAFMGLLAVRNIPLFALAAPIVLTRHAEPWLQELGSIRKLKKAGRRQPAGWLPLLNASIVGLLALGALARLAAVFPGEANLQHLATKLPVGAVKYLQRERPPGALFNSYNWGGYLLWTLREYPVFVDGRTDLYADGLFDDWLSTVSAKPGWEATLDKWRVRLVLVEPAWPLAQVLATAGWQLLYEDELSVLYGR